MSTDNRRARRAAERELRRLERRLATNPARPILRAAERRPPAPAPTVPAAPAPRKASVGPQPHENARRHPPGGPDESVRAADRPQEALPPPPTHLPPPNDGSAFPLWARLLTLPPNLDPSFRQFLFRHIETAIAPRDAHEHWLAACIATAMARLHLNAQREPESPSPAWLRYETLADRQLRQAHRDLKAYRVEKAVAQPNPPGPVVERRADDATRRPPPPRPGHGPHLTPQPPPILPDPTFVAPPLSRRLILPEPTPALPPFRDPTPRRPPPRGGPLA